MTTTDLPLIPVPAAPAGHEYRRVRVDVFSGACGAVVSGVDLASELDDDVVAEIRRALLDHAVIFFREQSLTPERAGRVQPPVRAVQPGAVRRGDHRPSRSDRCGARRERAERARVRRLVALRLLFLPEPPMGSILHAIEVPPYGADTLWANQYLAYKGLSKSMRDVVSSLRGVHSAVNAYSPKMQAIHDLFAGMTVQTSDDANRMQRTSGGARPRRDSSSARCSSTSNTPSISRASIRTSRSCCSTTCSSTRPSTATRAAGSGPRATSRSGTTAACNTW